jgi:hypothetical protein
MRRLDAADKSIPLNEAFDRLRSATSNGSTNFGSSQVSEQNCRACAGCGQSSRTNPFAVNRPSNRRPPASSLARPGPAPVSRVMRTPEPPAARLPFQRGCIRAGRPFVTPAARHALPAAAAIKLEALLLALNISLRDPARAVLCHPIATGFRLAERRAPRPGNRQTQCSGQHQLAFHNHVPRTVAKRPRAVQRRATMAPRRARVYSTTIPVTTIGVFGSLPGNGPRAGSRSTAAIASSTSMPLVTRPNTA